MSSDFALSAGFRAPAAFAASMWVCRDVTTNAASPADACGAGDDEEEEEDGLLAGGVVGGRFPAVEGGGPLTGVEGGVAGPVGELTGGRFVGMVGGGVFDCGLNAFEDSNCGGGGVNVVVGGGATPLDGPADGLNTLRLVGGGGADEV